MEEGEGKGENETVVGGGIEEGKERQRRRGRERGRERLINAIKFKM